MEKNMRKYIFFCITETLFCTAKTVHYDVTRLYINHTLIKNTL